MSAPRILAVSAALAILLAAQPGFAQDKAPPDPRDRAEQAAREGVQKLLRALELLIHSVPQYEMPEIQDNGDIVIRRKRPKETPETPPAAPGEGKST